MRISLSRQTCMHQMNGGEKKWYENNAVRMSNDGNGHNKTIIEKIKLFAILHVASFVFHFHYFSFLLRIERWALFVWLSDAIVCWMLLAADGSGTREVQIRIIIIIEKFMRNMYKLNTTIFINKTR